MELNKNKVDCEFAAAGQCRLINNKLGIPVGLSDGFCTKCLSKGINSKDSVDLRDSVVDKINKYVSENPRAAEKLNALVGWRETRPSWSKAASWLKSEVSKRVGKISLNVLDQRKQSCFGGVSSEACNMLRKHTDGFHYCGSCGCGVREEARLDGKPSKLEYPYLECPLKKPGFSNHNSV